MTKLTAAFRNFANASKKLSHTRQQPLLYKSLKKVLISTRSPGFYHGYVHVGFVVESVGPEQIIPIISFSPSTHHSTNVPHSLIHDRHTAVLATDSNINLLRTRCISII